MRRSNSEIAREGDFKPAPQGYTMNCGNGRAGEFFDSVKCVLTLFDELREAFCRDVLRESVQVSARDKDLRLRALDNKAFQGFLGFKEIKMRVQFIKGLLVKYIRD